MPFLKEPGRALTLIDPKMSNREDNLIDKFPGEIAKSRNYH